MRRLCHEEFKVVPFWFVYGEMGVLEDIVKEENKRSKLGREEKQVMSVGRNVSESLDSWRVFYLRC